MGGDDTEIWLKSGDKKISFDIIIPTPKGSLYVMYMKRTGAINNEMANASIDKWSIHTVHERSGHCSEDTTRKTAKALDLVVKHNRVCFVNHALAVCPRPSSSCFIHSHDTTAIIP